MRAEMGDIGIIEVTQVMTWSTTWKGKKGVFPDEGECFKCPGAERLISRRDATETEKVRGRKGLLFGF